MTLNMIKIKSQLLFLFVKQWLCKCGIIVAFAFVFIVFQPFKG